MEKWWSIVRALFAAVMLLLLVVGLPVALVAAVGPLGPASPVAGIGRWVRLETPLSSDAVGDVLAGRAPLPTDWLMALLLVVMWVLWAQIVWAVLVEGWSMVRGSLAPRAWTMPGVQQSVARLLAGVTLASSLSLRVASAGPLLPIDDSALQLDAGVDGVDAVAGEGQLRDSVGRRTDRERSTASGTGLSMSQRNLVSTVRPSHGASVPQTPSYHVTVSGDTLWDLSERLLGSGMRWRDLRDANVGREMPDGTTISSTTELLRPNWPLVVPLEGSSPATSSLHQVVDGDTLWSVARRDVATDSDAGVPLSDGAVADRVEELIEINQLSSPDLLVPGQTLRLVSPTEGERVANSAGSPVPSPPVHPGLHLSSADPVPAPVDPAIEAPVDGVDELPADAPATPPTSVLASDDLGLELEHRADDPARGELTAGDPPEEVSPMTLEGTGSDNDGRDWRSVSLGLAAVSLVGGYLHLARQARRLSTLRAREPGHRPEPVVEHHRAPTRRLSAAAETGNHDLLSTTIRALGVLLVRDDPSILPQFWGAFVGANGLLLGLDPASPHRSVPRPFRELRDGSGWVVDREDLPALAELGRGANGVLPLLSTLGSIPVDEVDQATDRRGRRLLADLFDDAENVVCAVDLEAVRVLAVDARNPVEASATLATLVVELATSPLADEMEIIVVGLDAGVQSFTRVKTARSLGEVLPYLVGVAKRAELHQDVAGPFATRAVNGAADTWNPVVVVLGPEVHHGWGSPSEVATVLDLARSTEGGVTVLCGFDTGLDPALRLREQEVAFDWLPAPWTDRRFRRPDLDRSLVDDAIRDPRPAVPIDDEFWNPDRVDFDQPHPASVAELDRHEPHDALAVGHEPQRYEAEVFYEDPAVDGAEDAAVDGAEELAGGRTVPDGGWSAPPWSARSRAVPRPQPEPVQLSIETDRPGAGEPVRVSVLDGFTIGGHPIGDRAKPWKYSKTPELILYLLLHPAGASQDLLMEALFPYQPPNRSRLNQLVSDARTKALGVDGRGAFVLPHAAAGDPFYRLEPGIGFDLRDFAGHCAAARDAEDPTVETDAWVAALELVNSRPFLFPPEGFGWAAPEVEATIVKVEEAAVALADLAMDADDPALAVWATRKGLLTGTGYYELLTRRGHAALALGDPEEVVRAQADIRDALDWSDGPESFGADLGPSAELTEVHARLAEAGRGSGARR